MRLIERHHVQCRKLIYERQPPCYLGRLFDRLDPLELAIVRRQAAWRSTPLVFRLATAVNTLGDGWLYAALAILLLIVSGRTAWPSTLLAGESMAIAHLVYPLIKYYVARPRPTSRDQELSFVRPLDRYSFPSGHVMTATAAFLPIGAAYPIIGLGLLVVWAMLVWARLIVAHHYPSDLIVGTVFGAAAVGAASLLLGSSLQFARAFFATISSL